MLILVLGKGKTGSLVAEVARERGHSVRALDINENEHASALTAPHLAGVDVVVDFTAPEAAVENMRAVLALGGRIVVGTTGWYSQLAEHEGVGNAARRSPALRNQFLHRRAKAFPADEGTGQARRLQIFHRRNAPHLETRCAVRHSTDAQRNHSGCAARDRDSRYLASRRRRQGRAHSPAESGYDTLELRHNIGDRRCLALGAVRGAEWLAGKSGVWDFREIFAQL